jgi:teichuronic acid biosynthesis glycosyltransferase TuaH
MSTVVIPDGVDVLPLPAAPVPDDLSLPRPIAVVAGTLSERLDFSILEKVADSGMSLVLIGPASFRIDRAEFDRLCARHNVEWLGVKDHSDLATYYQHIDVGLVPYALSNFNLDSAPLKPLEYLAGGLPVVSTSLPGVIAISSPDIVFADDPVVFAMATQVAARLADDMDLVTRRRSHLDEWSWDARARELLSVLDRRSSSDRF